MSKGVGGIAPPVSVSKPPRALGVLKNTGIPPPVDRIQTALRHESKKRPMARGQVRTRMPASIRGGGHR